MKKIKNTFQMRSEKVKELKEKFNFNMDEIIIFKEELGKIYQERKDDNK